MKLAQNILTNKKYSDKNITLKSNIKNAEVFEMFYDRLLAK